MEIIALGVNLSLKGLNVTSEKFSSKQSILDYEILVWDPNNILSEYSKWPNDSTYKGQTLLEEDESANFLRDLERRQSEINQMLDLGRTVVIFAPKPEVFFTTIQQSLHDLIPPPTEFNLQKTLPDSWGIPPLTSGSGKK